MFKELGRFGDRKVDMREAIYEDTDLKKTAVSGAWWFSILCALVMIVIYYVWVSMFDFVLNQDDGILFRLSVNFFRFFLPFLGIVCAANGMRKLGTEYPVYKCDSFSGALKDAVTSPKLVYMIIPLLALVVAQYILLAPTCRIMPWYTIVIFVVYLYFDCRVEEYIFRGVLAELLIIKRRETFKGVVYSILYTGITACVCTSVILKYRWGFAANAITVIAILAFEVLLTFIYYRTVNISSSTLLKFIFKLTLLAPTILFGVTPASAYESIGSVYEYAYAGIFFVCYAILMLGMTNISGIPAKISEYHTERVNKFYARYGIEFSDEYYDGKKYSYNAYLNRRDGRSSSSANNLTSKYLAMAIGGGVLLMIAYGIAKHEIGFTEWQVVSAMGVEFVAIQISATFLIISFLSFLTSRDDYILWLDTMSHKFIYPKYFNFVDTSIYAFVAMGFSLMACLMGWANIMLAYFVIGIGVLINMTFKMVNVFFNRNSLLAEIERIYYKADVEEKNSLLSELYQNSIHVIGENDCQRIRENFSFLAKVYSVYRRQCICMNNAFLLDEYGNYAEKLSTVPLESTNMAFRFNVYAVRGEMDLFYYGENLPPEELGKFRGAKDINKLCARIENEIIYFVKMLLRMNPVLMAQLLSGYGGRLLEIGGLRKEITRYIKETIEAPDASAYSLSMFFRDVLPSCINALKQAERELVFISTDDEVPVRDSFITNIRECYDRIKREHPDEYDGICLAMVTDLYNSYESINSLLFELSYIATLENTHVSGVYTACVKKFSRQFDGFRKLYESFKETVSQPTNTN